MKFVIALALVGLAVGLSSPYKATLIDYRDVHWDNPVENIKMAVDGGFNVLILGFWTLEHGPVDFAVTWSTQMTEAMRKESLDYAHDHDAVILVCAGGPSDAPYLNSTGNDYGFKVADFAKTYGLDGIDFNMQFIGSGFTYGDLSGTQMINWLTGASMTAKQYLGEDSVISHSPQAPYFGKIGSASPNPNTGTSGGYTTIEWLTKGMIDFYNVVFFNQGSGCYVDYATIFVASNAEGNCKYYPGTSIGEISNYGVSLDKLVIAKPLLKTDSTDGGWISASDMNKIVDDGESQFGWKSGLYVFQWKDKDAADWINTVMPSQAKA